MGKPNIFFSHSSHDKKPLNLLKETLLEKIGSTVDVFLSSDGQSIPFGKNWVKEVESALSDCKIMIVFLTPASISSQWIYFEAGHAYSKGIKVIPVGFIGIDLANVNPPLSLLQGFNINNEKGLDNLIAIINDEFDFKHKSLFTTEEYKKICEGSNSLQSHSLGEYGWYLENLKIDIRFKKPNSSFSESMVNLEEKTDEIDIIKLFEDFFDSQNLEYTNESSRSLTGRNYHLRGISISIKNLGETTNVSLDIDPYILENTVDLLKSIVGQIRKENVKGLLLAFILSKEITCLNEWHKITGKNQDHLITLDKHQKALCYKDIFILFHSKEIFIESKPPRRERVPVLYFEMRENYIPIDQIRYVLNRFVQFGIFTQSQI